MGNILDAGALPSSMQLRRYAESQAYRLLQIRGFLPHERNITAAFRPSALTNLEAVRDWILELVSVLDHLTTETLDNDKVLPRTLELFFDERIQDVFLTDMIG
jgi:hypothetical protein